MNKKYITLILFLLVVLISFGTVNVIAVPSPYYLGDANLNGSRNIQDATAIQKYIAKIADFSLLQMYVSDADENGEITIKDATLIQKAIAKIKRLDGTIYPYVTFSGLYADFNSGKAMVNVPVKFTAEAFCVEKAEPLTYEFYVNDELISKGDKESFTYEFKSAGEYNVSIKCTNAFGYSEQREMTAYNVVDFYTDDKPVIKAFYADHSSFNDYEFHVADQNVVFTAEAIYGKGDYEYSFLLDGKVIQDFSEDNTYTFEKMPDYREEEYVLTVLVKDSSTSDDNVSEDYCFVIVV